MRLGGCWYGKVCSCILTAGGRECVIDAQRIGNGEIWMRDLDVRGIRARTDWSQGPYRSAGNRVKGP